MAQRRYIEASGSWMNPSAGTDNQWLEHDLSQYGVLPGSVAEIAVCNGSFISEFVGGVRATSGSMARFINIMKSEPTPGDTFVTMNVQVDTSGYIDYFAENFLANAFTVLGYWPNCTYVEKIEAFDPSTSGSWVGFALDTYGVGSGQVADILMANSTPSEPRGMGVRTSGSTRSDLFDLSEAEGGGFNPLAIPVLTSGANAAVELYAETTITSQFGLLGYFSDPPGVFTETTVLYAPPSASGAWSAWDIGSSGIPDNSIACLTIGRGLDSIAVVGTRETSSTIDRKFNLNWSENNDGRSYISMAIGIDSSGYAEQYSSVSGANEPRFLGVGYWNDFVQDATLPINTSTTLFIEGHRVTHYIENFTNIIGATVSGVWQSKDLSTDGFPSNVVAELVTTNESATSPAHLGVRAIGSSLERLLILRDGLDGSLEVDANTWHVSLDNEAKIQIFTSGILLHQDDARGLGYWTGCEYVELYETFQAGSQGAWVNHDLLSLGVPAGKIAEIIITSSDATTEQSGGIRQFGSNIDRVVDINGLVGGVTSAPGVDVIPMFVNTSGDNSTIQVYAGNSGLMNFVVAGYWNVPPGPFVELATQITPIADQSLWKRVDLFTDYDIPSGVVATFGLGNSAGSQANYLGVREIDTTLSQVASESRSVFPFDRRVQLRETSADDFGSDFYTAHVNVLDGYAEFYHQLPNIRTDIIALGYWDIYQAPVFEISGSVDLFINGTPPPASSIAASGDLYIQGVLVVNYNASATLYISGSLPPEESARVIDYLTKTQDFDPQLIGTFTTPPSSVNIEVWDIVNGQNVPVTLSSSGCYAIGDTGRWGWSTANLPFTQSSYKYQYYYRMVSNESESQYGEFFITVPEDGRWSYRDWEG